MDSAAHGWAAEILNVWFDVLGPADWFRGSEKVDTLLKRQFEENLIVLGSNPAADFLADARTARAAILLFDQVPRNLYRGSAQAFAYDALACSIAKTAIHNEWDTGLTDDQRQFVAMPLMHSEDLADQKASVAYFQRYLPKNVSFAESHLEMIAQFGRFPHRNVALGRATTAEEQRAIDNGFSW